MANLRELTDLYRRKGYTERNANARVCQDIVLKAISESGLNRNVTVKGGVVMRSITGDDRRATEDLDLAARYDSRRSFGSCKRDIQSSAVRQTACPVRRSPSIRDGARSTK